MAGRGPKGYQRSDERLREEISDRLMEDDSIYERGQAIADRRPWLLGDWPGLTNRGLAEAAGEDDRAAERPPSKIAVNP